MQIYNVCDFYFVAWSYGVHCAVWCAYENNVVAALRGAIGCVAVGALWRLEQNMIAMLVSCLWLYLHCSRRQTQRHA